MIVVLEGMDAAGKKTQSELLATALGGKRFAFPNYESATGQLILGHLKKEWACTGPESSSPIAHVDPMVLQSLQTVNRIEILPKIEEAMAAGPVVFDRYWHSGYVYGAIDGIDTEWLRAVQERPMPPADINILIDVPVEVGFERRPERRDRYESNRPFLERVRVEYLRLWGVDDLDWFKTYDAGHGATGRMIAKHSRPKWWVVDGRGSVEEVRQAIAQLIETEKAGGTR